MEESIGGYGSQKPILWGHFKNSEGGPALPQDLLRYFVCKQHSSIFHAVLGKFPPCP